MARRSSLLLLAATLLAAVAGAQIQLPAGYRVAATVPASALNVPGPIGGIEFQPDGRVLFMAGGASYSSASVYAVPVVRDPFTHRITGYGQGNPVASAPEIDGGLQFGPRVTLFFTRYQVNELGQIVGTTPFSAPLPSTTQSVGGLTFVPAGLPNAGQLLVSSYEKGDLFVVSLQDHNTGTFTPTAVNLFASLPAGTEGLRYVPSGSLAGDLLFANYDNKPASILTMDIDGNSGLPVGGSANPRLSTFATGIVGAEGLAFDPLTHDLLITTWQGTPSNSLIRVTGFPPPPMPLVSNRATVPVSGGSCTLTLDAGNDDAGRGYVILGSVSGTAPGFVINGIPVPLNLDSFSVAVAALLNTPLFTDFAGVTDAGGRAAGILNVPKLTAASVGLKVHFAAALVAPLSAASVAVTIEIVR
jgi:hypothetical protein